MSAILSLFLFAVLLTGKEQVAAQESQFRRRLKDYNNQEIVQGTLFTMANCPGKCMSFHNENATVGFGNCGTSASMKYWSLDHDCGSTESFFKINHEFTGLCISDPPDCSSPSKSVTMVDCASDAAAWFSYGKLHKTSPKAYNLYSASCWLNEGKLAVLATTSLDAKPDTVDLPTEACQKIEWTLDHYSSDVMYYEWSFNKIRDECNAFNLFN
eukprot:scaffold114805_cov56-Attheya_sp.AAC.2